MTRAVFFPSLMGVGILISGALLISDWLRRLLPYGALRRRHNVIVGTYGAIADAVGAAGYHLKEPWFLKRGLRRRWSYIPGEARPAIHRRRPNHDCRCSPVDAPKIPRG